MNGKSWLLAGILGVGGPLVGLLLGGTAPWVSIGASLLGSGAALALLLVADMSILLWVSSSVVFGVGVVLLHELLQRVFPLFAGMAYVSGLANTSAVIGAVAAVVLWRCRWPRTLHGVTRGDGMFLFVIMPIVVSTLVVSRVSGYRPGPDGRGEFHARGFVNGDTMTLFALVQASGIRQQAAGLLRENPFAENGPLEYPTLLHGTLARIMSATGSDITHAAWWLILPVLAGTVAVSVLSAKYFLRRQAVPWWAGGVLLVAYGTTWESFTYPQSHTFLTGLLLLFMLLLVRRDQSTARGERIALRYAIGTLAIILLFSNAVLGAAAVALAVTANILQTVNRSWPLRERVSGLIGAAILLTLFGLFPPGAGGLGKLNIAYTAVPQFLTAALPALVVLWGLWDTGWLHRSASLLGASVVLPALALATLFLSARDIVAENSSRFLFVLALLGWPAVVPLIQQVTDRWWRQVRHVEHTLAEFTVLWGGAAFAVAALLLPVFASVTGTLDVLLRKPPLVVSADELAAFRWIRTHTSPTAVFLRSPESLFDDPRVAPLSLPAFTGRAQLRSEYWLSPDDAVLADVQRFFREKEGSTPNANYLFCGPEVAQCPAVGVPAFSAGTVLIRALAD